MDEKQLPAGGGGVYPAGMKDPSDDVRAPPAGWLEAMQEADADVAAGHVVPLGPVMQRMLDAIARLEAKKPRKTASR